MLKKYLFLLSLLVSSSLSARTVIGIAGGTGSGKTTLATKIQALYPEKITLLTQDSYYKQFSHLSLEQRARLNFDHPETLDFGLLKEHVLALKNGSNVQCPCYNFSTHAREAFSTEVRSAEIILVEGILLLAVQEVRDLLDVKIFVETDDEIRLLRRIDRDQKERGRDFVGIKDQYLATVKPMHDLFVQPSKKFADVIIPAETNNDVAIGILDAFIKKELECCAQRAIDVAQAKMFPIAIVHRF